MDGWILTVDSLPVRGPDPGTPPADQGGHRAAHTHAPDPTRMHLTPPGCMYVCMYVWMDGWILTVCMYVCMNVCMHIFLYI